MGAAPILLRTPELGIPMLLRTLGPATPERGLSCMLLLTPPPILEAVGFAIALLDVDLEVAVGRMYEG